MKVYKVREVVTWAIYAEDEAEALRDHQEGGTCYGVSRVSVELDEESTERLVELECEA